VDDGTTCDLLFAEDELLFHDGVEEIGTVAYHDLTALEIGGKGATARGGGWRGGGFGLEGAAAGALIATALNLLTTRTAIDTVLCFQAPGAELFMHHAATTPESLRIELSQVFTKLRRTDVAGSGRESPTGAAATKIDRLSKLADLLERGVIDEAEFATLKAELLAARLA
jgi:hypothetical protein